MQAGSARPSSGALVASRCAAASIPGAPGRGSVPATPASRRCPSGRESTAPRFGRRPDPYLTTGRVSGGCRLAALGRQPRGSSR